MKIGLDISQTGKTRAGCGYVAYSLAHTFSRIDATNQYLLYSSFGDHYWDSSASATGLGIKNRNFISGLSFSTIEASRHFWQNPGEDVEAILGNPDIIHSNNFYCPTFIRHAKLVYSLHDLAFLENPEYSTEENRIACFDGVYKASLYADTIMAISEYTRQHFLRIFPHFPPEKIHTVYLGSRYVKDDNLQRPAKLPNEIQSDKFWLTVGTIEPRKNHKRLLEAYALLKQENKNMLPLVHAGGTGWMMDDFMEYVRELGLEKDIYFLGYVDETTLQWLYQNCFTFIFPSLFEGFGLPVLEAMSLGACVISASVTSLPEIVGDAGLLIDPNSSEEIRDNMRWLLHNEDERTAYKLKGLTQAGLFNWNTTAQKALEIYKSLLSVGKLAIA